MAHRRFGYDQDPDTFLFDLIVVDDSYRPDRPYNCLFAFVV